MDYHDPPFLRRVWIIISGITVGLTVRDSDDDAAPAARSGNVVVGAVAPHGMRLSRDRCSGLWTRAQARTPTVFRAWRGQRSVHVMTWSSVASTVHATRVSAQRARLHDIREMEIATMLANVWPRWPRSSALGDPHHSGGAGR